MRTITELNASFMPFQLPKGPLVRTQQSIIILSYDILTRHFRYILLSWLCVVALSISVFLFQLTPSFRHGCLYGNSSPLESLFA